MTGTAYTTPVRQGLLAFGRLPDALAVFYAVGMDPRRELLQHFLATLAYRTQKAVRDAPETFGDFDAGHAVRTPRALVQHMSTVLDYARSCFGAARQRPEALPTLGEELERFHATLADVAAALESGRPIEGGMTLERILQGPLADAMTHAGQLALLRRLAGVPVPPENFAQADVDRRRLGPDQALDAPRVAR